MSGWGRGRRGGGKVSEWVGKGEKGREKVSEWVGKGGEGEGER